MSRGKLSYNETTTIPGYKLEHLKSTSSWYKSKWIFKVHQFCSSHEEGRTQLTILYPWSMFPRTMEAMMACTKPLSGAFWNTIYNCHKFLTLCKSFSGQLLLHLNYRNARHAEVINLEIRVEHSSTSTTTSTINLSLYILYSNLHHSLWSLSHIPKAITVNHLSQFTCNDSICGSHSRNNMLDYTLRKG